MKNHLLFLTILYTLTLSSCKQKTNRFHYIKGNDTIVSIINNDREILYTRHKYTSKDTLLLKEAMDYLDISQCYLFDTVLILKYYFNDRYNKCYAMYNDFLYSRNKWLFIDEETEENIYNLEKDIRVRIVDSGELYTTYATNKILTKEQIIQVVKKCKDKPKIIHFKVNESPNREYYASFINLWLYMLDDNKTYKIDIDKNGEWKLILSKTF